MPLFVFLALGLGVATAAGTPPELLAEVAFGIGSPLWFLAAYGITQCCVPLMMRLHERAPWATLAVLLVLAGAVDAVRLATGVAEVGCSTSGRCGSSRSSSGSSGPTAGSRGARRCCCWASPSPRTPCSCR
ncbi:hypothetical protein [Curtobacterium aurantiacum]|uniref:Uncharacterized protein n=1 Tax=Curtobacterium aurantiacum TaxID=3236919 RepID=A0ABS5VCB3_9MICO|nr:hypothetical protein [Curtobacterium flaccumfaciens]MBT1544344.1 hypothetical protein [Curtobacterium flaccumfaciens pv. flaccumfaciens]MBT1587077.1 hypothetical protein [Curtobacterium flaccumfaciens pv. flaccumfaciens]